MNTKKHILAATLFLLVGCTATSSNNKVNQGVIEQSPATYETILTHSHQGWSEQFSHEQGGMLSSVLNQLVSASEQASMNYKALDSLLYYLRAYSYYGDINKLTEQNWHALEQTLQQITRSPSFYDNSDMALRIQEHVLVSLYRYATHKKSLINQELTSQSLSALVAHFNQLKLATNKLTSQQEYTQLELYRAIGFIAYEARRNKGLKTVLIDEKSSLTANLTKHINQLRDNNWELHNGLWAIASLHYLMPDEQQQQLDKAISQFIFGNSSFSLAEQQQLFSQIYLVNSFRYQEQCDDEFKGKCLIPDIDQILPVNHTCSDSLFIRATAMTAAQLNSTCDKLTSQESFFHHTINSQKAPVANDLNTKLRVVIFDNYSEYNRWGQLFFNIGTDNGGMYIEGTPDKVGNQATFFSFEAFWQQPEFSVWNLNHEYVHYLDGRFVKYGPFGHFPSHLVWWSEGLAEYISKQNVNDRAFKLLIDNPQDKWPTLSDIFATKYSDGLDRTYRWSYQAIRFIFDNHPQQGQQLASFLKNNDFDSYEKLLNDIASKHQQAFLNWQLTHIPTDAKKNIAVEANETKEQVKPKFMYRYLYRDYLRPEHLPITDKHKHFSNWG